MIMVLAEVQYFGEKANSTLVKNKLNVAITDMLSGFNRVLVADKGVKEFQKLVARRINSLNQEYSQLSPCTYQWRHTMCKASGVGDWKLFFNDHPFQPEYILRAVKYLVATDGEGCSI